MHKNIKKYLVKNSMDYSLESSCSEILNKKFRDVVVIPAFAEIEFLPHSLKSLYESIKASDEDVLCLVVVNNPLQHECDPAKFADNQSLLKYLREKRADNTAWIDASSPGKEISKNGGVGAARKIGMDMALTLLDWSNDPLIFSLDADTLVEKNYISSVRTYFSKNSAKFAVTLDFRHRDGDTPEEEIAIRLYESYMKDYVEKLESAGSPYAYFSIGSTIVCRADKYVKAGGMRPKNGGEDFYFMQAVRKLDSAKVIGRTIDTSVYPSSRASDRVPFGTGPRIAQIVTGENDGTPGKYLHNPQIFTELKTILTTVEEGNIINDYNAWYQDLPQIAVEFLNSFAFCETWPKILKNTPNDPEKIKWAFHTWFDAFRTLKFVHFCEDCNSDKYGRIKNLYTK